MAIVNGYASDDLVNATNLSNVKARLELGGSTGQDANLEKVIEAVSREIDEYTGRRFFAETKTMYFTAEAADYLEVPDLISVSALKTDDDGDRTYENTWASTDYDLWPFNALTRTPHKPYTEIHVNPEGDYLFPRNRRKGVEIAGSWGFSDGSTYKVPRQITEACILRTLQLWKRKDTLFGVQGQSAFGSYTLRIKFDNDIEELLRPFVRYVGVF